MISKHVHYEAAHDNYGALARYIADSGHEGEKCLMSWCAGCAADDDYELAIVEAQAVQDLNTGSRKEKTYHLLVSFRPVHIATKFGIDRDPNDSYKRSINNSPAYIRKACEGSLQRLGVDRIDLYYAHRINLDADIAETMGTLADLKLEGKIAHIGLCEVSAATLERAHAVHPVTVLQSEYSLWMREVEDSILPLCRRLGIGFVRTARSVEAS